MRSTLFGVKKANGPSLLPHVTPSNEHIHRRSGRPLRVQQFGPLLGEPGGGGIASVVQTMLGTTDRPYSYGHTPTAGLTRPFYSLDLWVRALVTVVGLRVKYRRIVAHVHLSDGGSLRREGSVGVLATLLRIPTIVSCHASELDTILTDDRAAMLRVLRPVAIVHALGPLEAAKLSGALGPGHNVVTIPNSVPMPTESPGAGSQPQTVLFGGEVGTRKGVDVLLAAWPKVMAELPAARLIIAGPVRDVTVAPTDGVTTLGPVAPSQMGQLMREARVAVLPSRREALPMFLIEAMANARPVVATPVGDVASLVSADWLVPVADADSLANAIIRLLADPELATRVGAANRVVIASRFSVQVVLPQFDALYAEMAGL
jgi:glycosyltransferase involved in cell wall biosynthesis